jgi:hypothetical protein
MVITDRVKDLAGNSFAGNFRYLFRVFFDPSVENAYIVVDQASESRTTLHFPAGSFPQLGAIGAEPDPESFPWGFSPGSESIATQKQMGQGGEYARPLSQRYVTNFMANQAQGSGTLKAGATITIPFRDEDGDGYIDQVASPPGAGNVNALDGYANAGIRIKVSTLGLYRLDEPHNIWVRVPGATVDVQSKVVRGNVYQLGLFAVMGAPSNDVSNSYAYPVPFVASKDQTIKFVNLPDEGTVKIYTSVTGEMIKEIHFVPGHPDPIEWNVTNASGEPLGSDVYLYEIKSGGNRKTGKIVIVR